MERVSRVNEWPKNEQNKENTINFDPSRAWIKNSGPGCTKTLPKEYFNRNRILTKKMEPRQLLMKSTKQSTETCSGRSVKIAVADDKNVPSKLHGGSHFIAIEKPILNVNDAPLVMNTVDSTVIDESAFLSCIMDKTTDHQTLAISGIETIDLTEIDSSIELNKSPNRQQTANTIDVNNKSKPNKAIATYRFKDIPSHSPAAESTLIPLNSTQASDTCVRIANAGNELRNMHSSSSK